MGATRSGPRDRGGADVWLRRYPTDAMTVLAHPIRKPVPVRGSPRTNGGDPLTRDALRSGLPLRYLRPGSLRYRGFAHALQPLRELLAGSLRVALRESYWRGARAVLSGEFSGPHQEVGGSLFLWTPRRRVPTGVSRVDANKEAHLTSANRMTSQHLFSTRSCGGWAECGLSNIIDVRRATETRCPI